MRPRRKTLLIVLVGLLLLAGALWFFRGSGNPDHAAREKLDQLLGESDAPADQPPIDVPQDDDGNSEGRSLFPPGWNPFQAAPSGNDSEPNNPAQPGGPFGLPFPFPKIGVEVNERADVYELRVPLADPQDESGVQLNVQPHRIEVSGQNGSHKGGVKTSTSFMQSFNTTAELLPDKVSRRTETQGDQTTLVITIPKKHPGEMSTPKNAPDIAPPFVQGEPPPPTEDNRSILPAPTHDTI